MLRCEIDAGFYVTCLWVLPCVLVVVFLAACVLAPVLTGVQNGNDGGTR